MDSTPDPEALSDAEEIVAGIVRLSAASAALAELLIDKGIITRAEYAEELQRQHATLDAAAESAARRRHRRRSRHDRPDN